MQWVSRDRPDARCFKARMVLLLAPLFLSMAQAAAAPPPASQQFVSRRGGRLFISPMGEPFRPKDRNDDALADWFDQADRNHDGRLTLEEMQQDSDRFFATLDIGKDGEIDPEDVTRYETDVAPEVQIGSRFEAGGFLRSSKDQHQGAGRYGLLDLPEPVVSADSNFNRGVSLNEFRAATQQRFLALDLDHHGYLTLPMLESIRPAPPSAPNPPERPKDMPLPSPQP